MGVDDKKVRCPCQQCGKTYSWKSELAGKKGKCVCGGTVEFPATDPSLAASQSAPAGTMPIDPNEEKITASGVYAFRPEPPANPHISTPKGLMASDDGEPEESEESEEKAKGLRRFFGKK